MKFSGTRVLTWQGMDLFLGKERHPNAHTEGWGASVTLMGENFLTYIKALDHFPDAQVLEVMKAPKTHSKPITLAAMAGDGKWLELMCITPGSHKAARVRFTFPDHCPKGRHDLCGFIADFNRLQTTRIAGATSAERQQRPASGSPRHLLQTEMVTERPQVQ